MGSRLVVAPYETLTFSEKRVMVPGGTKEVFKIQLEFKCTTG